MKISILMPVYNEEKTLQEIVDRVEKVNLSPIIKEIVIVDDDSSDDSQKIIEQLKKKYPNIKSFSHDINRGKGAAIKTAFKHSTGEIITIQDGDLEYNPEDLKKLIKPILEKKTKVIYGSRFLNEDYQSFYTFLKKKLPLPSHYFGNRFLSMFTRILYGQKITDMETCYKMMTREVFESIKIKSNRFDFEPEITVKIIKKGYKIIELPVNYNCRSFKEGKKITWKDGFSALYVLFKNRFSFS